MDEDESWVKLEGWRTYTLEMKGDGLLRRYAFQPLRKLVISLRRTYQKYLNIFEDK